VAQATSYQIAFGACGCAAIAIGVGCLYPAALRRRS